MNDRSKNYRESIDSIKSISLDDFDTSADTKWSSLVKPKLENLIDRYEVLVPLVELHEQDSKNYFLTTTDKLRNRVTVYLDQAKNAALYSEGVSPEKAFSELIDYERKFNYINQDSAFTDLYIQHALGVLDPTSIDTFKNDAVNKIDSAKKTADEANERVEAKLEECDELIREARAVLENEQRRAALDNQKSVFKDAAKKSGDTARMWLAVAIVAGAWIVCVWNREVIPSTSPTAISNIYQAMKIMPFAALVLIAMKQYGVARHIQTWNQSKHDSISAFGNIISYEVDEEAKRLAYAQLCDAVFSQRDTGYVKNEDAANSGGFVKLAADLLVKTKQP